MIKTSSWLALLALLALPVSSAVSTARAASEPTPAEIEKEIDALPASAFDYLAGENSTPAELEPSLVPSSTTKILIVAHKNVAAGEKQYMEAFFDQEATPFFSVLISTGKAGHSTPEGTFKVTKMVKDYWSQSYNAPMPWSIFFKPGYALHATDPAFYADLGVPASHGCVRQHFDDAQELYETVLQYGAKNTTIIIQ